MATLENILAELRVDGEKYTADNADDQARKRLLESARSLISQLETPNEYIMRSTWAEPARNTAMMIALDSGLLDQLSSLAPSKASQIQGVSTVKLSEAAGVEKDVVIMVMRHLAAMNLVRETGPDHFAATPMLTHLMEPGHTSGLYVGMDCLIPCMLAFRFALKDRGWKSTTSVTDAAAQRAFNMDTTFYAWLLGQRPDLAKHFHTYMTSYRLGVPKWFDEGFYPVRERMAHPDLNDTSILLVDVGGGFGSDISGFEKEHGTSLKGRIILQDVPPVIEGAKASGKLSERIEAIPYDFMTPEPIKGARAYHMHSILHNWPDNEGHVILQNIRDAMKPGFSKLFIYEHVISEQNARWSATAEDMIMRSFFSSKERTKADWQDLLTPHGLEITGIWSVQGGEESLIEIEVAS